MVIPMLGIGLDVRHGPVRMRNRSSADEVSGRGRDQGDRETNDDQ